MSGHSHWATIKRKKEANDQAKGKVFAKLSREIMLAIAEGGNITDPEKNVRLRAAIEKAKESNMPKENIVRLIDRLKQRAEAVSEVVYEALGPEPVTFIIKTATDNPRRTQTDIGIILTKNGGKLVPKNAVMYNFDHVGMFTVESADELAVLDWIEKLGAIDFDRDENTYYIYVPFASFAESWQIAKALGINKAPELVYRAKSKPEVDDETVQKAMELVELIENVDEVQSVFLNI